MISSIRTALVAVAATALLTSCGTSPQARVVGGAAPAAMTTPADKAARLHLLTANPVCTCNAARGLGIDANNNYVSFAVVDNPAGDEANLQVRVGAGTYEITDPNNVDVVIAGNDVTITAASIPLIAGTGPDPLVNVVVNFNTATGVFTVTVGGSLVASGTATAGFREAIPGSCTEPSPFSFPG